MSQLRILISNDDGIYSPNLDLLVESVVDMGEVIVVAPAQNQSSMGRSYPKNDKTGIITKVPKTIAGKIIESYAVEASPALTITHAFAEILEKKPAICLTGINIGENIGSTMTGSGTVMGAIEASSFDMPAIAFSKMGGIIGQLDAIKYWIKRLTTQVLKKGLPQTVSALNINFPADLTEQTPVDVTRLSSQIYFDVEADKSRNWAEPHYIKVIKKFDVKTVETDSDIYSVVIKKNISITPISWDFTAHGHSNDLKDRLNI